MLIGILSDTHDRLARTHTAVQHLIDNGADVLIHCGDLNGPDIVRACAVLPAWYVFGNNEDEFAVLRRTIADTGGVCLDWGGEVTLGEKRLAVTHGHLSRELRQLLAGRPDYLLTGHTHQPLDRREGSMRHINPGALHRAEKYTVALLDPEKDDLRFIDVPR